MSYDGFETGARKSKRRYLIFALVGMVFLAAAWLFASNYHNVGNLIKVVSLVRTQYLYPIESGQLMDGAIRGLVDSLGDPYSVYLEPETFTYLQEQIRGSFGGLGILVGVQEEYLVVVRAYKGTPAEKEGIKDGDLILMIDDLDARGVDLDTAIGLMRGPVGSEISLTVDRQGVAEQLHFTLTREEINVPTVEGQMIEGTGIEHIVISQFTERTAGEMEAVLEQAKEDNAAGIILDLRNNPGGELYAAVEVSGNFIPQGPVVYIEYKDGSREQVLESNGRTVELPLAVLINDGSASAAEILAGAVKDTDSGVLVGTKTFGKGIVQTVFRLDDGAGLKLTTAHYLTPAKHNIHEKGIEPDVLIQEQDDQSRDVQLNKAVELLQGQINQAG